MASIKIIKIPCTHPKRLGSLTVHLSLTVQPIVTKKICSIELVLTATYFNLEDSCLVLSSGVVNLVAVRQLDGRSR